MPGFPPGNITPHFLKSRLVLLTTVALTAGVAHADLYRSLDALTAFLDQALPAEVAPAPEGARVAVPLGTRRGVGVVAGTGCGQAYGSRVGS